MTVFMEDGDMCLPDWRTFSGGTRVRVALWLASEVGEGGRFTKSHLRGAFPSVEQIDRRMRDLRPEGWVIHTYREDRGLAVDELRLVTIGGSVWEKGYRSKQSAISDKDRKATLAADGHLCTLCGVGAGESYPDDRIRQARLLVRRDEARDGASRLRTVCERCVVGDSSSDSVDRFLSDTHGLTPDSRSRLLHWVRSGDRSQAPEDRLWSRYRRLSREEQDEIGLRLR